jgi:2-polyprenyl-6-methoxyphenol hydroxylase-like FAD-dependent oxidoreductase
MTGSAADVLIVGAGPTGLLLAGDLADAGLAVTVLERRKDEMPWTRAFVVHARTLELLDARGVADELIATGQTLSTQVLFGNVKVDLSRLPSRFPFLLTTPQYETERVLEARARKLGAAILTGTEATGLRQDATGVAVDAREVDGAGRVWRAAYLVGADGLDSTVRKALGLPFPGRPVMESIMLADVRLADPPPNVLMASAVRGAFAFVAPFGDGWYRIFAWDHDRQRPGNAPVELEEVRAITRKALGSDFGMHDPRWLSRFHSDERQVPRYRVGRVFLIGDAAHIDTPAGAQGMNTGLQDAANLSWKLAAAVQGWAPPWLLDTYQPERYRAGRLARRSSGALVRVVMLRSWPMRTLRKLATTVVRMGPVSRRVAGVMSGIDLRYPAPRGAPRQVGTRAADIPLEHHDGGPTRLYEVLRSGHFALVTPGDRPALPANVAEHVDVVTRADGGRSTVLVRPDGYIGWTGTDISEVSAFAAEP